MKYNQRAFIAGATGSGKSILACRLIAPLDRVLIIDPKGDMHPGLWNYVDDTKANVNRYLARRDKDGLLQPVRLRVTEPERALKLIEQAYRMGDTFVYLDEVSSLCPPGKPPHPAIVDVLTRGRSRGCGMLSVSQRPVTVPRIMLSESNYFYAFRLMVQDDRKTMAGFGGPQFLDNPNDTEHPFAFHAYNTNADVYQYNAGLDLTPREVKILNEDS